MRSKMLTSSDGHLSGRVLDLGSMPESVPFSPPLHVEWRFEGGTGG